MKLNVKFEKGDYVEIQHNWTLRVSPNKAYKIIDMYPIWVMNSGRLSSMENYLIIEDELDTKTGYSAGKFKLSPNNLKLKRLDKLKKLNEIL